MNMFSDADSVESVIFQAIGLGSMCWESLNGTGTFNDNLAKRAGEDAVERLRELGATQ